MKKVSMIVALFVLMMAFTGCSSNEMKLYNAMNKTQEITSLEADTELSFNFDVEGLSQEEQMQMQQMQQMVNNSKMKFHQKTIQNEDQTVLESKVDMNMDFGGMAVNTTAWVDVDMSGDDLKLVEVIQIPAAMKGMLSPEDPNKEYLVYDFMAMTNQDEVNKAGMAESIKIMKKVEPEIQKLMKNFASKFDVKFVEYKGNQEVDGEKLDIYEVRLDDASAKKLFRDTVDELLVSEEGLAFVKAYMNVILNAQGSTTEDQKITLEEIEEGMKEFENNREEFRKNAHKIFDAFENVRVLGEDGIVIEYGVNEEGYIAKNNVSIDLRISPKDIKVAASKVDGSPVPAAMDNKVYKVKLNYNTKVYNINEDVQIEDPNLTVENTLYASDLFNPPAMEQEMDVNAVETVEQ